MVFILLWIGLSFAVAAIGNDRRIGFAGTLVLALLLSPLIGLIAALLSNSNQTQPTFAKPIEINKFDQLEKLSKLKTDGAVTDEEFETEKKKLLS